MTCEVPEKIARIVGNLPSTGRMPKDRAYPYETIDPVKDGFVDHGKVKSYYALFGASGPVIVFAPIYPIVHMSILKGNVPYLARHFRVLAIDACGNGRSDRPRSRTAYTFEEGYAELVGVLDHLNLDRIAIVGHSRSAMTAIRLAAEQPDRVSHLIVIGGFLNMLISDDSAAAGAEESGTYMREHWVDFLDEFWTGLYSEPHSTKPYEDGVRYGLATTGHCVEAARTGWFGTDVSGDAARVTCPTLVIHGTDDQIVGLDGGIAVHRAIPHSQLITLEGSGHAPHGRDPARLNHIIRDFVGPHPEEIKRSRAIGRPRRALFVSSPIGLGHVQRDLAIARKLREIDPGLSIEWFTVDPAVRYLQQEGERVHPATSELANESRHFEAMAGEHDLSAFLALRSMDEIMTYNFMIFNDVVESEDFDIVIGDEAWDVDYHYHENPELKRQPFVFLTDFVGFLPVEGTERESFLCADRNADDIEHVARFPYIRDSAIFVGNPDDVVEDTFGPGLPAIRTWTDQNFRYCGYALPFEVESLLDTEAVRCRLGYDVNEKLVIVSVGGTAVGHHLLHKIAGAFPAMKRSIPNLHMVVVTGPRLGGEGYPSDPGLEVRPYIHKLYEHLACCDLAMVQGGLATCMELVSLGKPFISFPLQRHFEREQIHVRRRLQNYGVNCFMDYDAVSSDDVAVQALALMDRPLTYAPVETDGAARAAEMIAARIARRGG